MTEYTFKNIKTVESYLPESIKVTKSLTVSVDNVCLVRYKGRSYYDNRDEFCHTYKTQVYYLRSIWPVYPYNPRNFSRMHHIITDALYDNHIRDFNSHVQGRTVFALNIDEAIKVYLDLSYPVHVISRKQWRMLKRLYREG